MTLTLKYNKTLMLHLEDKQLLTNTARMLFAFSVNKAYEAGTLFFSRTCLRVTNLDTLNPGAGSTFISLQFRLDTKSNPVGSQKR